MAATEMRMPEQFNTIENHDSALANKTKDLSLGDAHEDDYHGEHTQGQHLPNGLADDNDASVYPDDEDYHREGNQAEQHMDMDNVLASHPDDVKQANGDATSIATSRNRPMIHDEPSRSYIKPIPIVTTYEPDIPDNTSVRRKSVAGSVKPQSLRPSTKASVRAPTKADTIRAPSRAASVRAPTVQAESVRSPTVRAESVRAPPNRAESIRSQRPASVRPASIRPSVRGDNRFSHMAEGAMGGAAVGEVVSSERQREMQQQSGDQDHRGVSLNDQGPVQNTGAARPASAFGYRPQPNIMGGTEDGRDSRYDSNRDSGRDSRQGMLGRSGTVISRANTVGRSGTLSRAANGGTVGGRRGAFGRGAGASVGTQPEEVLGRDDIHTRAELSERILDEQTLRRLTGMERKDAKRLSRVIQNEGKAEAMAVKGSIKELERLSRLQKEAASTERNSQQRLSKWTSKEHKARLRFLKEKERYEKIEGELRNAENDYEERRDHAAGLTAQVAEKTQELDDLRGQKAADDRERAVKLLALQNPAHS